MYAILIRQKLIFIGFLLGFAHNLLALDKRVLLIGVDGAQYEKLLSLTTPAFDRLHHYKAYAGGIKDFRTEQLTSSGPGWATILTGVWSNKHDVLNNTTGPANSRWPSVFRYVYNASESAEIYSFSTWGTINADYFPYDLSFMAGHSEGGGDESSLNRALDVLRGANPKFVFIHLDEPDGAGHSYGFGARYNEALIRTDIRLGKLLDEVERREQQNTEEWLVLVTTDHGRKSSGYGHGGQSLSEKTVFIASNKILNEHYKQLAVVRNPDFSGLYEHPAQTFIVPTILQFLGIWKKEYMLLDGLPLLGIIDGKRLYSPIAGRQCGFEWDSNPGTPLTLASYEHVAKFDCDGNADSLVIAANTIYSHIYGTGCGLQWDADAGSPSTLGNSEHVAKFDCENTPDTLLITDHTISTNISGRSCGLQWDSDTGTPGTIGVNEHVAKFDCGGVSDLITIE